MTSETNPRRRVILTILLILVPVLAFLGWSQASLNLNFIRPTNSEETILLLALSTFIFLAFVIFTLILLRILLKLYVERQQEELGSRFKTKMVVAFLGVSMVPLIFLFIFAYGLLNRTIDKWFSVPLDVIRQNSEELVHELEIQAAQRADHISSYLAQNEDLIQAIEKHQPQRVSQLVSQEVAADPGIVAAMCFNGSGQVLAQAGDPWPDSAEIIRYFPADYHRENTSQRFNGPLADGQYELFISVDPSSTMPASTWAASPASCALPSKLTQISGKIQSEAQKYDELSHSAQSGEARVRLHAGPADAADSFHRHVVRPLLLQADYRAHPGAG